MQLNEYLALSGDFQSNTRLCNMTTLKVGGQCRGLFQPDSIDSLIRAINYLKDNNVDFKLLGRGSNMLCSDDYYDGIIIKFDSYLTHYKREGRQIMVEAGCSLVNLANQCAIMGLSGLQFAGGIPGSVGGAVYMNAGAYRHTMSEIVSRVLILDEKQKLRWLRYDECEFDYRSSIFHHQPWIIIQVELVFEPLSSKHIFEIMKNRKEARVTTQPLDLPSAGSCFKNPEDKPAWKFIEEAGLRGFRIGGACVSEKHANFIVNDNNASAKDVLAVIKHVESKVKEAAAVTLEKEMELFNWDEKKTK